MGELRGEMEALQHWLQYHLTPGLQRTEPRTTAI
jgi:hypothetical protein